MSNIKSTTVKGQLTTKSNHLIDSQNSDKSAHMNDMLMRNQYAVDRLRSLVDSLDAFADKLIGVQPEALLKGESSDKENSSSFIYEFKNQIDQFEDLNDKITEVSNRLNSML